VASVTAPVLPVTDEVSRVEVRPTRAGLVAALLALVMLAAALNTGNNLLYLLAALVVSTFPVSIRLACRSLSAASVDLLAPAEVIAGDEAAAALRIRASEGWVAGLSVKLMEGPGVGLAFLEEGASCSRPLPLRTGKRGPLRVETRLDCLYPWGLMRASREGPAADLLVLPRPIPGAEAPSLLGLVTDGRPTLLPGQGQDLLEIREYVRGDDARRIDWKATARRERTMVRQGAREEERRTTVVIDPSAHGQDADSQQRVEDAISRAAGAVTSLLRAGWRVRLVHPAGTCSSGELEQQRTLARLEIPERPLAPGWWHSIAAPGEPVVVCSATDPNS